MLKQVPKLNGFFINFILIFDDSPKCKTCRIVNQNIEDGAKALGMIVCKLFEKRLYRYSFFFTVYFVRDIV